MIPRLKEAYSKEIQPALKESLGLKNIFMTPKVEKVVLNMGLGLDGADAKVLKACEEDMSKITGQKPVITKFKKSVANFKTRKGTNAGLKVTLRENKMYEFLDRLVNIALPRIKDFRGLSPKGFDKFGNYTFEYNRQMLSTSDGEQKLTSKEAELLKLLCENMNNVLDRTVALNKIWFDDSYFNARSMDVYITKLRKYLKGDASVELINVHGVGFKLVVS